MSDKAGGALERDPPALFVLYLFLGYELGVLDED